MTQQELNEAAARALEAGQRESGCAVCGLEFTGMVRMYDENLCHGERSCTRWAEAVRRERQYRRVVRREVVTAVLSRALGFMIVQEAREGRKTK